MGGRTAQNYHSSQFRHHVPVADISAPQMYTTGDDDDTW